MGPEKHAQFRRSRGILLLLIILLLLLQLWLLLLLLLLLLIQLLLLLLLLHLLLLLLLLQESYNPSSEETELKNLQSLLSSEETEDKQESDKMSDRDKKQYFTYMKESIALLDNKIEKVKAELKALEEVKRSHLENVLKLVEEVLFNVKHSQEGDKPASGAAVSLEQV